MGITLDLQVIEEGIEDQATLDYVSNNHCNLGQGHYLYKLMDKQKITQILHTEVPPPYLNQSLFFSHILFIQHH